MNDEFTQGTILYGVRSDKYKDTCCYGVIISARCDIANCKIPKFYYLIALDLADWIYSLEGFQRITSQKRSDLENRLIERANNKSLDWDTLLTLTDDELLKVINDNEVGFEKDASKFIKDFNKYKELSSDSIDYDKRKKLLSDEKSAITDFLHKISMGQIIHNCFIPQSAYIENSKCVDNGLIIDLQELEQLTITEAELIKKRVMDIMSPDLNEDQIKKYNRKFFLDDEYGYVEIVGSIISPWIEYLMQRFSNAFTRIGVDGPNKQQIINFVNNI